MSLKKIKWISFLSLFASVMGVASAYQIEAGFPKATSLNTRAACDNVVDDCTKGRVKAVIFAPYNKVVAIEKDPNRLKEFSSEQTQESYVYVPGERPLVYVKVQIFFLYTKDAYMRYTFTESADQLRIDFVNECAPDGKCGSMPLNRGFVVLTKLADGNAVGLDYGLTLNANLPSIVSDETKRSKMIESFNYYVKTLEKLALR